MKKKITLALLIMAITGIELPAQFPVNISINSKGTLSATPSTKTNAVYRITVEGTYSMWPQYSDCHGVDGAYVYDVPQEEIDNFRWPPEKIFGIPFVELPHWVGDPQSYSFPPKELGFTPLFEMSFIKNTGLRIDGIPLPNTGFDKTSHKYTIEMPGTGKPFVFQILDSNFNISQQKTLPRYDDNCGFLLATVEEIITDTAYKMKICNEEMVNQGGKDYLVISLKLYDGRNADESRNLIEDIDSLAIKIGDKYYYSTTYKCTGGRKPINAFFMLDNSGSMLAGPRRTDTIQRIDAALEYIKTLVNSGTLIDVDSVSLSAFRDNPQTLSSWNTLAYTRTNLNAILYNIKAGWKTGLEAALGEAINSFPASGRKKAVFILSDYYDNIVANPSFSSAASFNGRAFLLNYGMGASRTDTTGIKNLTFLKSKFSNAGLYNYPDFNSISEDLSNFAGKSSNTDCCEYKIPLDPCMFGVDTTVLVEIVFSIGFSKYTFEHYLMLDCKTDTIDPSLIMRPSAIDGSQGIIEIEAPGGNNPTMAKISDINGRTVTESSGYTSFTLDISSLPKGLYFLITERNGKTTIQKIVIY